MPNLKSAFCRHIGAQICLLLRRVGGNPYGHLLILMARAALHNITVAKGGHHAAGISRHPKTTDHEIAKRIIAMFTWNVSKPDDQIKVKVILAL